MEKKTMGSFMAALRKANGLTQQQVADLLNVSNKTVSKWECNDGFPEITMLPTIAEIYSVTVDELLRGERITKVQEDDASSETKFKKQAAQAMYIFNSATDKYKILSIISIVISIASIFIVPLMRSYNYFVSMIGVLVFVLMMGSAVVLEILGVIRYNSILNQTEVNIVEDMIIKGKKSIRKYSVVVCAVVLSEIMLVALYDLLYLGMIITAVVTFFSSYILFSYISKKYSLTTDVGEEYIYFKKKVIRLIAALLMITWVVCIIVVIVNCINGAPALDVISIWTAIACMVSIGLIIIGMLILSVARFMIVRKQRKK